MEEKQNISQNEYNNIPQFTDSQTLNYKANDNSFQGKSSFLKNKKTKIILISIIGIILIGIIIGIAIACSNKKSKSDEIITNNIDSNNNNSPNSNTN